MSAVVVDLETFGVAPDSAVVTIGAVNVDTNEQFYEQIANPSGRIDAGTVQWWFRQAPAVIAEAREGKPELIVLALFAEWLTKQRSGENGLRLWGSEDFDTVILGAAYDRHGLTRPWSYFESRGLRTIFEIAGVDEDAIPWVGVEHVAIDCAVHAATALRMALAARRED